MTLGGIKEALTRLDNIECFVLTSTFKIYPGRMIKSSIVLDETNAVIKCEDKEGLVDYMIDIGDIDVIVFNKGNKLNPNFPL